MHKQVDQSICIEKKKHKVPFCASMLTDRGPKVYDLGLARMTDYCFFCKQIIADLSKHFTVIFKADKQVSEHIHTK